MGRFETTAGTYARYREPYPAAFFAEIASRLGLRGNETLIDLGTGPGVLALGFRPYIGSILGVDPEPNMLAAAAAAARSEGIALPLLAGRAEDLPSDIGTFDVVSIGRALHWMNRPATLEVLDRILKPEGAILICGARVERSDDNPWRETVERLIHAWAPGAASGWSAVYEGWFDDTPFVPDGVVETRFLHPVTPEALFERILTRSSTSPAVLGDRIDACRAELTAALEPFFPKGARDEVLVAKADIFRRR